MDSVDQDQTARNVQSDLDLYCPLKAVQLRLETKGLNYINSPLSKKIVLSIHVKQCPEKGLIKLALPNTGYESRGGFFSFLFTVILDNDILR